MQTEMNREDVFKTFPRQQIHGSLTGAQPKLSVVRDADGNYVQQAVSDEEHAARFEMCEDLAVQLRDYCVRKSPSLPDISQSTLFERACTGVKAKAPGWGLDAAERDWVMRRAGELLTAAGWKGLAFG
ncbi:hypothetical protein D3C71_328480 [compost metagenome]